MRTSEEIFRDVEESIITEVLSNADFRETFTLLEEGQNSYSHKFDKRADCAMIA